MNFPLYGIKISPYFSEWLNVAHYVRYFFFKLRIRLRIDFISPRVQRRPKHVYYLLLSFGFVDPGLHQKAFNLSYSLRR